MSRQRRILFIDDETSILRVMGKYFTKLGYQTFEATTGKAGIATFAKVNPDVTVLDLNLPDITGLDVLAELRRKRAMVIMLTGEGEVEHAVEAMRLGAENFLTKPIEMDHLQVAADKAIEKAALRRENVKLRARLNPDFKRRALRAALFVGFAATSAVVGSAIGRPRQPVRPRAPIPVQINPQDTITPPPDMVIPFTADSRNP